MTLREAVQLLQDGYGDDCPEGGDRYREAMQVLHREGLVDASAVPDEPEWTWWEGIFPGPSTNLAGLSHILRDFYVTPMQYALNQPSVLLAAIKSEQDFLYRVEP